MTQHSLDDSVSSLSANEQSYGSCNLLADQWESRRPVAAMLRVRLKADGRIVEILPDGSEAALPSPLAEIAQQMRQGRPAGGWVAAARPARALLKVIDEVPEVAFAVLSAAKPQT